MKRLLRNPRRSFLRLFRRPARRCRRRSCAASFSGAWPARAAEVLEDRWLLSTIVVDFTGPSLPDDGKTTFQEALSEAWETPGTTITFAGPMVIRGEWRIPESTVIDGENKGVVFEDTGNDFFPVLSLLGDTTVRGLTIRPSGLPDDLFWMGIRTFRGQGGNRIENNFIGLDPEGVSAHVHDNLEATGILLSESEGDIIQGNVISVPHQFNPGTDHALDSGALDALSSYGIFIRGARGTKILGNRIGTDKDGLAPLGNGAGIYIIGGSDIEIGGPLSDPQQGNVISGNTAGIVLKRRDFLSDNYFGDGFPAETAGRLASPPIERVTIAGNYIGTTADGTGRLGNGVGVFVTGEALRYDEAGQLQKVVGTDNVTGTVIGTTREPASTRGDRNVISGNAVGVRIERGAAVEHLAGNLIGTDAYGLNALGNTTGIELVYSGEDFGGISTIIGGSSGERTRNVISGNVTGVLVRGTRSGGAAVIIGNYIGTNRDGTAPPTGGLGEIGVLIKDGASDVFVGLPDLDGQRNVISGSRRYGVRIEGAGTTDNHIQGNYIGTDKDGTAALELDGEETDAGVLITSGASANVVGGTAAGSRNVISGHQAIGVVIEGADTTDNRIEGNYIGTDRTGTARLAGGNSNAIGGAVIRGGASNNLIGGTAEGARNVISGNRGSGVGIGNEGTTGNKVLGNYIGIDASGEKALPNGTSGIGAGVLIAAGAQLNEIGGTGERARNIISGNATHGVAIRGAETKRNKVLGNYIGTDASGEKAVPNGTPESDGGAGVQLAGGAQRNEIGGLDDRARNVISGNARAGVLIQDQDTRLNTVVGNLIGTNASGTEAVANEVGVWIAVAPDNTVGDLFGKGNVISGNREAGVRISGTEASRNEVIGNFIGTDQEGLRSLSNQVGIDIWEAPTNFVGLARDGGFTEASGNVISGNSEAGLVIRGAGAQGNRVERNYIGTNRDGTDRLADGRSNEQGVVIRQGATGNFIGGGAEGARNVISGNQHTGVLIAGANTMDNEVRGNYVGTDKDGLERLGNGQNGVSIVDGSNNRIVGNLISANSFGVIISRSEGVADAPMGNRIAGNFIGPDKNGNAGSRLARTHGLNIGNGTGILMSGAAGTIIESNLIRGNHDGGVQVGNSEKTDVLGNTVSFNDYGILLSGAKDTTIGGASGVLDGGPATHPGNLIRDNILAIVILGSERTSILGNEIRAGDDPLESVLFEHIGVSVTGSEQTTLGNAEIAADGSVDRASGNLIAGFDVGVRVTTSTETALFGNELVNNDLAVQCRDAFVSLNGDTGFNPLEDFDCHPFGGQPFTITGTTSSPVNSTLMEGVVTGPPDSTVRVEFFLESEPDSTGGTFLEEFLGAAQVTTDSQGVAYFREIIEPTLDPGRRVTLSVTGVDADTAFSPSIVVTPLPPPDEISVANVAVAEGDAITTQFDVTITRRNVSDRTVTVELSTADGSATAADGDYTPVSGLVVTFAPGVVQQTVRLEIAGDGVLGPDETFDLVLGDPTGGAVIGRDTATVTIVDDDSTSISISDAVVLKPDEETAALEFTVSLSGPIGRSLTVEVNTADGTATVADGDYTRVSGLLLTFDPGGPLSQTVTVEVHGDTVAEADELLFVHLSNPTGLDVTLADPVGEGVILNDVTTAISISDAVVTESGAASTLMEFVVSLSHSSDSPVTVEVNTADGSATAADGDYVPISGRVLTFEPGGPLSQVVSVVIPNDATVERDETFSARLSNATGTSVAIVDSTGVGTIRNDDTTTIGVHTLLSTLHAPEGTGGTSALQFVISLSQPSAERVTVEFSTEDGTATAADGDFQPVAGRVITIPPGELQAVTTVDVIADAMMEIDEHFAVRLTNATGLNVSISSPLTVVTIENDDRSAYSVDNVTLLEGDEGPTGFAFTVSLSNPADQPLSVRIDTSDGSARAADGDYEPITNLVWNYSPGDPLTFPVIVNVAGNLATQPDRTFRVILSDASPPAVIVDAVGLGTIVNDDADTDGDGISDALEDLAPNSGDANGDGTPDRDQPNLAPVPNAIDGGYVAVVSPAGTHLTGALALANPDPADSPPGITFPAGFFDFSVTGLSPGGATTITMLLPAGVALDTFYNYGRQSSADPADGFYQFLFDGTSGAEILPDRIVLHLVDGGRGDNDLTADGVITGRRAPGTVTGTDLSLTVNASPEPVGQNRPLRYTLTVTNNGPKAATGARLVDTLPVGATFVAAASSQGVLTEAGGVVTFEIGDLPPGAIATATIDVLAPPEPGIAVNTAVVSVSEGDLDASNNVAVQETLVKLVGVISGQKFQDDNGNGRRDPGEIGLNGFTIELIDPATDQVLATTTTRPIDLDDDGVIDPETERGCYEFAVLVGGTYEVREVSLPGFTPTFPAGDTGGDGPTSISHLFADRLYPTGTRPVAIATGDLDGNGDPDVVTANNGGFGVSVLLNNGDGTLRERTDYGDASAFNRPVDVQLGDVNDDGVLDIVAANSIPTVTVLLGNGDGTFGTPQAYDLELEITSFDTAPVSVALGDANNDGLLDVITANNNDTVTVLFNTGTSDPRFANPVHFDLLPGPFDVVVAPADVAVADLNADGNLDIVAGGRHARTAVLLGAGDGSFASFPLLESPLLGGGQVALAVADLNSDDVPDLVAAGEDDFGRFLAYAPGNGDGTFATRTRIGLGDRPRDLTLGDVDGDGNLDLILTAGVNVSGRPILDRLLVFSGRGDGSFAPPVEWNKGTDAVSVTTADMNGDSRLDVVMVHRRGDQVFVLLADEAGRLGAADLETPAPIGALALGDLNNDGRLDLVTGVAIIDSLPEKTSVLLGIEGGFAGPIDSDLGFEGVDFRGFELADVDHDGILDLIFNVHGGGAEFRLGVGLGRGDGTFATPSFLSHLAGHSLDVADVNGDGHPDIAAGSLGGDLLMLFGRGDGTFRGPVTYGFQPGTAIGPQLVLAEIDDDGDADLVTTGSGGLKTRRQRDMDAEGGILFDAGTREFRIDGTRDFNDQVTITADLSGNVTVEMNWVDAGGTLRTVTESSNGVPVSRIIFEHGFGDFQINNQANQTVQLVHPFAEEAIHSAGNSPASPVLGDLDSDGDLDALVHNDGGFRGDQVSVLLNNGDGAFGAPISYAIGEGGAGHVALGDVNGDGILDILASNLVSSSVSMSLGAGDGTFSARADFAVPEPRDIALGDLDGNGRLDLVAITRAGLSPRFNPFLSSAGPADPVHSVTIVPGEIVSGRDFGNQGEFQFDFGDAPDSYSTSLSNDGARHALGGPFLGSLVEPESDGQPAVSAAGDDHDGLDDGDGVAFTSALVQGESAYVRVSASAELRLDAWIDFDANGVFDHPAEQVFAGLVLAPGDNDLQFSVPPGASAGVTYARFRASTTGGLSPVGGAPDGEVEDYRVQIIAPADLAVSIADRIDPIVALSPFFSAAAGVSDSGFLPPESSIRDSLADYTITVTNTGPADAEEVVVTIDLPPDVFTVGSPDGTSFELTSNGVTCRLGTIPVGGSRQFRILADTALGALSTFTVVARVDSSAPDSNPVNNVAVEQTTVVEQADLGITLTGGPDPVTAGDQVTYTATVINRGPSDAHNVTVEVDLPPGVTFVDTAGIAEEPGTPRFSLGTLGGGRSKQVTFTVSIGSAVRGTIITLARVEASTAEAHPGDEQATAETLVVGTNSPPEITELISSSPECGGAAEGEIVTITGVFLDPDFGDTHAVAVDWGDGTASAATVSISNGIGTFSASHAYADGGIYTIRAVVQDRDGEQAEGTTTAVVTGAGVVGDTLYVIGTDAPDHVTINREQKGPHGSQFKVHADFLPDHGRWRAFAVEGIEQIVVMLCDGDDHATIASNITTTVVLDGGAGNDHLNGGHGPNIILAGAGDDRILGGPGRDILIGGSGRDFLLGGSGDDILIGGTTIRDGDLAALLAILAEWNSSRSFDERVANLRGRGGTAERENGAFFLSPELDVANDGDIDIFAGKLALDLVFAEDLDRILFGRDSGDNDKRGRHR